MCHVDYSTSTPGHQMIETVINTLHLFGMPSLAFLKLFGLYTSIENGTTSRQTLQTADFLTSTASTIEALAIAFFIAFILFLCRASRATK